GQPPARPRASPPAMPGRTPPRAAAPARTAPRTWSMREEDGVAIAPHADIEAQRAVLRFGDEGRAALLVETRPHRVGRVRLGLVRKVDARELVLEQPAGEHEHVEPGRFAGQRLRLGDHEREPALRIGAASPPAPPRRIPELDPSVVCVGPVPCGEHSDQAHRGGIAWIRELVLRVAGQADRVERPDGLRRRPRQRHASSSGVVPAPPRPRAMSHWYPSAHSGCVVSRSKRATSNARAFGSRTDVAIGSYSISGSPGKYIWVTSLCVNWRPKHPQWMCCGRHAFSWLPHGYEPGLIVTKR